MEKLRSGTPKVIDHYFANHSAVKDRLNKFWRNFEDHLVRQVNKCLDLSGTELEAVRKRRDDEAERKILSGDLSLELDANKDFWAVFWGHGTYIKETMLANDNCNQDRAMELLRRVDRYRYIMEWHYCDKVDKDYPACSWVFYKGWGDNPGTVPRGRPRTWASFRQNGGKFSRGGEN